MPSTYKILAQDAIVDTPSSTKTVYTVPAGKQVVVSSLIFTSTSNLDSRAWIVKSGESTSTTNRIVTNSTGRITFKGIALSAGDRVIIGIGNANATTTCQIFGAEID